MSFNEGLINFGAASSMFVNFGAMNYGIISYGTFNNLMFATVVIVSISLWRHLRAKN
jgi:hypothetical protein